MNRSRILAILMIVLSASLAMVAVITLSAAEQRIYRFIYLPVVTGQGSAGSTAGTLRDAGTLIGVDGFLLGTVTGTLTTTLPITITRVGPPPTPLDPNDMPLGEFYEIAAAHDLFTAADHPILLGLPVPDGVNTDHLAAAVLLPAAGILDNEGPDPQWFHFRGIYDPAEKLFLVAINGLSSANYQVVLVDSPNLAPLTPTTANLSLLQPQSATFEVLCNSTYNSSADCGPTQTAAVATELGKAYDDFQGLLTFNNPHLPDRIYGFNPMRLFAYHSYYNILLVPPATATCVVEGQYVANSNMEICVPPGSTIGDYETEVIRHEYFHATQYGYDTILNHPVDRWVTDGTATAAQRSTTVMTRSQQYDLHPVDIPITRQTITETYHYAAQDFWVFAGLKNGSGIDYLKPLFDDHGAQTQDVVQALGDGTHLPLYWDWVKNQVMEKEHDFDGALANKCELQADVVVNQQYFSFDWQGVFGYDAGIVEPLNSTVVQVLWDGSYDIADGSVIPTGGNNPAALAALRYKLYRDGESGCKPIPDGRRLFDKMDGPIDPAHDYYVVISNIDPVNPYPYTVRFEVAPLPPN